MKLVMPYVLPDIGGLTPWVSREQRRIAFASRARSARVLDPLVRLQRTHEP